MRGVRIKKDQQNKDKRQRPTHQSSFDRTQVKTPLNLCPYPPIPSQHHSSLVTTELVSSPHFPLPSNSSLYSPAQRLVNTGPGTSSTSPSNFIQAEFC
ncbi:hypothetical protein K435DRAFT_301353 [Dendrothele bispora CBS 962.96]|uniref:Uncharacterized protein n=1 Tax=Dendrothele bispora (strain CBS 962.96) TaxID=1314807 RepID=A0A4S8LK28_DENBC|nr:hypothetical protein K435DRAFT_301353 [Dendrothele bispora CBS 962.96]